MKKGRPQQPQLSEIMEGSPAQPQLSEIDIVGSPEQPQLSKIDIVGSPEQPQLSEIIKMVGSPAQLQLSEIMDGSPAQPQLSEIDIVGSPEQLQLSKIDIVGSPEQPQLSEIIKMVGSPAQLQLSEIMLGSPAQPQLSEIDIVGSPSQPQLSEIDIAASPQQPHILGSPTQPQLSEIDIAESPQQGRIQLRGSPAQLQLSEINNKLGSPAQLQLSGFMLGSPAQPQLSKIDIAASPQQFSLFGSPAQPQLSKIDIAASRQRFPIDESPSQFQLSEIYIAASPQQHCILGSPAQPQLSEIDIAASPQQFPISGSPAQPQLSKIDIASPQQPQLAPIARNESLSRVVQPNVNPGESAHQPQLTEAQIAANNEIRSAEHLKYYRPVYLAAQRGDWATTKSSIYYRPLYLAAQRGDWLTAKSFIEHDPNALTATITAFTKKTVLHVAAYCWQWEFVLKLLERTSPESIVVQDDRGQTVLHDVAQGGSLKTAKALVRKNPDLLQIVDKDGDPPLLYAVWSGNNSNKELVWYLSLKTIFDSPSHPFLFLSLPGILHNLILSGYHDIALYFIKRYPNLAIAKDKDGDSLLYWLATNPSSFVSGSNLGFLERWIYKFVHVEIRNPQTHLNMEDSPENILESFQTLQPRNFATKVFQWFKRLLWKTITKLVPYVKKVRDAKLKHECAVELVNHVCTQLSSMSFQQIMLFLRDPKHIMASAVTGGIEEIVRALFRHFPDLIDFRLMPERNILQAAIEHRQEKIVNLIKEIFPTATKNLSSNKMESKNTTLPLSGELAPTKNISSQKLESGNTTLHLAGKLAPPFKLHSVSGAALQMQRELQWFKEVEEIAFLDQREKKNMKNETPKEVFRREHKELAKEGEKWMKDTANSCMLVSTLIATVLFAAAFTVPGGNINDKGIPIFLRTNAFTVFAISDALGLFSSLTSLLMFLAILTARYDIEDFLKSLPKKLIIGLGSLFFAIAAMITAFGAALTIILGERWHWVFMPITLVASLPVVMFVWLQLPLFVQMFRSTFGASIFRPWPSRV